MSNPKEIKEIAQSEAKDKTAKIIAGILPMGSAAYELITTIVVPLHEKKKHEFINDLATRLKRLEKQGHIDYEELAQSEEFNTIITKAILLAQQNHQKEKLEALRNITIHSAIDLPKGLLEFDEMEYFLRILERITPTHIFLLKTFHDPNAVPNERKAKYTPNLPANSEQLIKILYPELTKKMPLITQYWRELNGLGLLQGDTMAIGRHTKHKYQKLTTELGDRFLEKIEINSLEL